MSILEHASLMTDEIRRVPLEELQIRLARFREEMEKGHPGWQMAVINNKVNMYYFTGTMQEARWLSVRRTKFCGCAEAMTAPAMNRCCRISAQCRASALWRNFMVLALKLCMWNAEKQLLTG